MALLDLLGRRWALRILWELRDRSLTFRALRASCEEMSPSVLSLRLAELRDAGIVTLRARGGYALSPEGEILLRELGDLDAWAKRWARRVRLQTLESDTMTRTARVSLRGRIIARRSANPGANWDLDRTVEVAIQEDERLEREGFNPAPRFRSERRRNNHRYLGTWVSGCHFGWLNPR